METKLQQIKKNFNKLKDIRLQITNLLNIIEIKIHKLKTKTKTFIDTNKNNLFTFGLDSYQFQNKLIEYEYDDMKKNYNIFNNRMYCEYYKLYKLVSSFVQESMSINKNLELLKLGNIFPVYKDLEPLKCYSFEIIEDLHKTIILLLSDINDYIEEKENELVELKKQQHSTLHIHNFLNTYEYNIISIQHKGLLYISYLEFFHIIHTKNFNRFANKMKTIDDYINIDIDINENHSENHNDNEINEINETITKQIEPTKTTTIKSTFNISTNDVKETKNMKSIFKSNANKVINGLKMLKNRNNHLADSLIHNKYDNNDNHSEISINSFDTNESLKEKNILMDVPNKISSNSSSNSSSNNSLIDLHINIDKEHVNKIFDELTNNCYEILNSSNNDDDVTNDDSNIVSNLDSNIDSNLVSVDDTNIDSNIDSNLVSVDDTNIESNNDNVVIDDVAILNDDL
jgi:hypothetical protein